MKSKFIILCLSFLFINIPINAQQGWYEQTSGTTESLNGVYFTNSNVGWVVGANGITLKTTNSGENWIYKPSSTQYHLRGVHFVDSSTGWALGGTAEPDFISAIIKTTDGGETWFTQFTYQIDNSGLFSFFFTSKDTGWIVGGRWEVPLNGFILYTGDGGESWDTSYTINGYWLEAINFSDNINGWVAGLLGTILRTTDGGANWDSHRLSDTTISFESIYFTDSNNGWGCGGLSRILHTTDGGISWNIQTALAGPTLYSIHFVDNLTGYAVGETGKIYNTTDGGENWNHQSVSQSSFHSVFFTDENNGWIVGSSGKILKKTTSHFIIVQKPNGGEVWEVLSQQTIEWVSDSVNYVAIDYSTDNGLSWMTITPSVPATPGSYDWIVPNTESTQCLVRVSDANNSSVFDESDGVFTITIINTLEIKETIPTEYDLSRNYPNPFNPSTKIKFTVPTSPLSPSPYQGEGNRERFVTLKVYDVLGNEIATLVNEEKPAGEYEVEFSANSHSGEVRNLPAGRQGLTSGIYFYQLKSGSYIETKKMLLLR